MEALVEVWVLDMEAACTDSSVDHLELAPLEDTVLVL